MRSIEHARKASLCGVFDHVEIGVSDLAASERFYRTVLSVLGVEPSHADAELVEWDDWGIVPADGEHPVTRGLHVGFRAPTRQAVDAFWQAGIDAGHRDDGAPGPRTVYGSDYYGGFLLDPDGNSVEAVHDVRERPVPDGRVDHLWVRVADPAASKRFQLAVAPHTGMRLVADETRARPLRGRRPQHHVPPRRAARDDARPPRVRGARRRRRARVPRRRARRGLRGLRRARRARRLPLGLLRRVREVARPSRIGP